jgi:hypothetical protein
MANQLLIPLSHTVHATLIAIHAVVVFPLFPDAVPMQENNCHEIVFFLSSFLAECSFCTSTKNGAIL